MVNELVESRSQQIGFPAVSQPVSDEEALYWLALLLVPGLGPISSVRLIERFKTPMMVLRATPSELVGCGLTHSVARSITSGCTFDDAVSQHGALHPP
jgi:hypothetical protein